MVGDDCLRAVAAAMRDVLHRHGDLASRHRGEQLAVILHDTDSEGALEMMERLRLAIESLGLPHDGNPEGVGRVTVSRFSDRIVAIGRDIRMPEGPASRRRHLPYKAKQRPKPHRSRTAPRIGKVPTAV